MKRILDRDIGGEEAFGLTRAVLLVSFVATVSGYIILLGWMVHSVINTVGWLGTAIALIVSGFLLWFIALTTDRANGE